MYSTAAIQSVKAATIYAYEITTGNMLWQTTPISMGNTGYWDYVPMSIGTFAAGNIYWYGSEHSPGPNLESGFKIGAINASTGEQIWNITFWYSGGGIGRGIPIASQYMTLLNAYDNQIYCFGRGPTATKLQTPITEVASGQGLVIQGAVMDTSPGTKQTCNRLTVRKWCSSGL